MANSTTPKTSDKPNKPYPDFPLFPHATKRWVKKIRGKLHYFGHWDDPDGALKKYQEQRDDLHAGRTPRVSGAGVSLADLCNAFWKAKKLKMEMGQLSPHSFRDYHETCARLVEVFGRNRLVSDLRADDFMVLLSSMKTWGAVSRGNEVNRVRVAFKWGFDSGLYDALPRYGPEFKRPPKKDVRLARARRGPRMFEAGELQNILAASEQPLKAMILLGINCGLGNADCGRLPLSALDLHRGWLNYHREKTGINRRCPLWPETIAALREAIAQRPTPNEEALAERVFLSKRGASLFKTNTDNPVSRAMSELLKKIGIKGQRNFCCLRHGLETIGGESRDQPAVDFIMGHERGDMASVYRERIGDDRLRAVAEHVRVWLYGGPQKRRKKAQIQ